MKTSTIAMFGMLAAGAVHAQFTYPNCDPLDASQFKAKEIFAKTTAGADALDPTLEEPVQFALHGVKNGATLSHIDVYFVQRLGKVKHYDAAAKKVNTIGTISVWANVASDKRQDGGLMGIAVDPDFATNKWLYLWYVPPVANAANDYRRLKLGRFTVKADGQLDMNSEKVLINVQGSKLDKWHSGGPMLFDTYGDLWIQVGNNSDDINAANSHLSKDSLSNDEWGSGNTMSFRGGTIRIHPDNSEKGYSIPKGNFGEYWADQFEKQGRTALAALYRNHSRVVPEVYVKGERSNYSLGVHPTKRWLAWGTVNYASAHEEFNITKTPIFSGFPYFHGDNDRTPGHQEMLGYLVDPAKPLNKSKLITGMDTLPPAVPGVMNGDKWATVAIGGPIYHYDRNNPSTTKFPPHLDNSWMGFDFERHRMYLWKVDTNTLKPTFELTTSGAGGLFSITPRNPLSGRYGPDGAFYLLNYSGFYSTNNPALTRIDYTGKCQLEPSAIADRKDIRDDLRVSLTPSRLAVREEGEHTFSLHALDGREILRRTGLQHAEYAFAALRAEHGLKGLYLIKVKTARGLYVRPTLL